MNLCAADFMGAFHPKQANLSHGADNVGRERSINFTILPMSADYRRDVFNPIEQVCKHIASRGGRSFSLRQRLRF
jgi:hypothetical protein